jgi:hypothetical protein
MMRRARARAKRARRARARRVSAARAKARARRIRAILWLALGGGLISDGKCNPSGEGGFEGDSVGEESEGDPPARQLCGEIKSLGRLPSDSNPSARELRGGCCTPVRQVACGGFPLAKPPYRDRDYDSALLYVQWHRHYPYEIERRGTFHELGSPAVLPVLDYGSVLPYTLSI